MKRIFIVIFIVLLSSCRTAKDYYDDASKLVKENKFAEAIVLLDKAIDKNPYYLDAIIDRGLCKVKLDKYADAIVDFEAALKVDNKNTRVIYEIGCCHYALKDYKRAIDAFNRALDTKGGQIMTIDLIQNSTSFNPRAKYDVSAAEIIFERGASYYYLNDYNKSYDDFAFCVEKKCYPDDSYYFMAIICFIYDKQADGCTNLSLARQNGRHDEDIDPKYLKLCSGK